MAKAGRSSSHVRPARNASAWAFCSLQGDTCNARTLRDNRSTTILEILRTILRSARYGGSDANGYPRCGLLPAASINRTSTRVCPRSMVDLNQISRNVLSGNVRLAIHHFSMHSLATEAVSFPFISFICIEKPVSLIELIVIFYHEHGINTF